MHKIQLAGLVDPVLAAALAASQVAVFCFSVKGENGIQV
jgi:hypothetical protein